MEVHGPSEENDGSFMLKLSRADPSCPDCGEESQADKCAACGAEVVASDDLSGSAAVRSRAFADLSDRAEGVCRSFETAPVSGPKITGDQFAGAIVQTGLLSLLADVELSCQRLSVFDFDDEAAVSKEIRPAIASELDLAEQLRDVCMELSGFLVPALVAELRRDLLGKCLRPVEMLTVFLEMLSLTTASGVEECKERLQGIISSGKRYGDVLDRLEDFLEHADVDERIALLTGREGHYVDELGFVAVDRVFASYAREEGAYMELGKVAVSYFQHLLPTEIDLGNGAMLILPAISLASLDQPLVAHRCAQEMAGLVNRAVKLDSASVEDAFGQSTREGPKLFAAASRVHKGMRLIRVALQVDEVDEELLLREVLTGYQEIAESTLRSHGWAILKLQAIVEGEAEPEGDPPTLGSLQQRLQASKSQVARTLGEAVDVDLRNATAHSQYVWRSEDERVEDLSTGKQWTLEDLEEKTAALGDSVVGVDAGYVCGVAGAGVDLASFEFEPTHSMRQLLAEAAFAVAGYSVENLSADGATATVQAIDQRHDLAALMTAVAAQAAVVSEVDTFRVVESDSGRSLLDVPAERMRAATKGPELTKDLELIQCFTDSAKRTGAPAADAATESLALQSKAVAIVGMIELVTKGSAAAEGIRTRSEAVLSFVQSHAELDVSTAKLMTQRLQRVVGDSYRSAQGGDSAAKSLWRRLRSVLSWADEEGTTWPPALAS